MSISALSSNLITDLSQQENPFRQVRQNFQQLATAIQNGDLSGAQAAYSSIQQLLGSGSASSWSSNSGGSATLQNDFSALGSALQSGDISQAQSAFSQLQSDARAAAQQSGAGAGWGSGLIAGQDQYVSAQGQNPVEEALQDYAHLASDVQNGDLADAQSAYSSLQQLVQAYQGPSSSNSTIQNDFAALGQDLQNGTVSATQSAFSQLQSDLEAAGPAQTRPLTPAQQVRQDYAQLASALQRGDLSGAQSAFGALQQALQTQPESSTAGPTTGSSADSNDPIANDLNALSQALSSGNLSQAQSAFSQLQSDIQAAQPRSLPSHNSARSQHAEGHHAHGRHYGGGGSINPSSSLTTSASNASGSALNVYA